MTRQICLVLHSTATWVVVGVVMFLAMMMNASENRSVASAIPQQQERAATKQTARPPSRLQEAMIKEAGEARAEIVRKLQAGQYIEFMHQHSPIDDYVINLREGRAGRVEMRQMLGFANLANTLESLNDAEISVDAPGRVATFTKKQSSEAPPAPKGPYSKSAAAAVGYGNDLKVVIQAAQDDLKAKKYEHFTERMFPPSTIAMMKTDGRWEALQTSLSPESPLAEKMLKDLALLKDLEPKIADGTAEFEMPNHVKVRNGREEKDTVVGTRRIRFSLIDGSWRFYDSTAKIPEEINAALAREPAGESATALLVLEKIGSDWRLRQVPRIQPQAHVIPSSPVGVPKAEAEILKSIPAKK